jgi:hypothetical protein
MPKPTKEGRVFLLARALPPFDSVLSHALSIAILCHAGATQDLNTYLSEPETVVNVVDKLVPTAVTAPMMTTAMSAAINPYSIAVAPPSWRQKLLMRLSMVRSPRKRVKVRALIAPHEGGRRPLTFIYENRLDSN